MLVRAARRALRRFIPKGDKDHGPDYSTPVVLLVFLVGFAGGGLYMLRISFWDKGCIRERLWSDEMAGHDRPVQPEAGSHMIMPCAPGTGNFEDFVTSVTDTLRARPLGKPCLLYFLDELANTLKLDTLWLEFGVWTGRSLNALARKSGALKRQKMVYGFDSFKGLPETWRSSSGILGDQWAAKWTLQGAFDLGGEAPEWGVDKKHAEFVVGWFNESLPKFLEKERGPVDFIHIDSDLYSSALTALSMLTPRIISGTVLVFDELINFPGFREGEVRALYEWLDSPDFAQAGLTGLQVIGYRGPNLFIDEGLLAGKIREQRGEGRLYPQDAIFRVW